MDNFYTDEGLETPIKKLFPEGYGYVILVAVAASLVNLAQMFNVGRHRSKGLATVPSTNIEGKDEFNIANRVFLNTCETMPLFMTALLIGGIRHSTLAAIFGLIWVIARVIFSIAYSIKPILRAIGFLPALIMQFCLLGCALSTGFGLLDVW